MGSLIARNNLRVFEGREIMELRRQMNFLPESWQSCLDFDNKNVIAIPWILDTYLVYYRRDLLAKAGIDEATAFSTVETFHSTLQKLQESGVNYPFAVPTNFSHSNIHLVASLLWGQGGDFIDSEGTRMLLSQPETRRGMKMYFDLFRFMPPEAKQLDDQHSWNLFREGKTAVTMRNAELLFRLKHHELPAEFAVNIGVAVVPGVPLLGGSNLIIWNHIRPEQEEDALDLIKFLTSTEAEVMLFEIAGLLPASLDALERIIDPTSIFAPAIQSVKTGRAFHRIRVWGLIEDKLAIGMSQIWDALLSTSDPDVNQIIADHLDPIETELNIMLAQ
jgi:multiple sugar transport system substrate-binding protein